MADEPTYPRIDPLGETDWGPEGNPFAHPSEVAPQPEAAPPDPKAAEAQPQQPEPAPQVTPPQEPEQPAATEPSQPEGTAPAATPEAASEPPVAEQQPSDLPDELRADLEASGYLKDGKFLGKYATVKDALEGARQGERWGTQTSQALRETERERDEARQLIEELRPHIQRALAMEQGQQAQGGATVPVANGQGQMQPPADLDFTDPAAVTSWVEQRIAQERQQIAAQVQSQMQAQFAQQTQQLQGQQQQSALHGEVAAFRQAHPDLEVGGPVDQGIAMVFQEYGRIPEDNAMKQVTRESLDIAMTLATNPQVKATMDRFGLLPGREEVRRASELAADPGLANYVAAHPDSLDADEQGWESVKQFASYPALLQGAQQGAVQTTQQQQQQAKTMAHLEPGGSGAPVQAAPDPRPTGNQQFIDTVVKAWAENKDSFATQPRGTS